MPNPIEPREVEALAVAQARMEGKIDVVIESNKNVLEKVTTWAAEIVVHRGQINTIESEVQQLQSDAKAAAKAVIDAEIARQTTAELLKEATAEALTAAKTADDKKVLDAKTLVEQSTTTWSKRQTLATIGGFILAIIVGVFGIVWALKTGTPPSVVPVLKP